MKEPIKKRGSIWRCFSPILIYMLLQEGVSFLVLLVYYSRQGLFEQMEQLNMDAVLNQMFSAVLENIDYLSFLTMAFSYVLLIPLFWWMYQKDRRRNQLRESAKTEISAEGAAGPTKVSVKYYGILLMGGAASCLAASNMISLSGMAETSAGYAEASNVLYSAGFLPELLVLGILSPIAEEFLFRGLIYRRFQEFTPLLSSMLWASLTFAFMHGNLVQGIYAFVIGFIFCYVYERYGSIVAPIVMHMASNLVSVIASETGILDVLYKDFVVFLTATFICCLLVVGMFYLIERYVRPITEQGE